MAGKPNPPKIYAREPIGRPSKFTEKVRNDIIDAIAHRIPYEMAAEANGITVTTLYDWLKTAREHIEQGIQSDFTVFSEGLKRAEMQKVREHVDMIAAKPERWQADAWILERRWHKHFSANAAVSDLNERLAKIEQGEQKNEERDQEEN